MRSVLFIIAMAAMVLAGCASDPMDTMPASYTDLTPEHVAAFCHDVENASDRRYSEATYRSVVMPLQQRHEALMALIEDARRAGRGDEVAYIFEIGFAECSIPVTTIGGEPKHIGACKAVKAGSRDPDKIALARAARAYGVCPDMPELDAIEAEAAAEAEAAQTAQKAAVDGYQRQTMVEACEAVLSGSTKPHHLELARTARTNGLCLDTPELGPILTAAGY
jgi:hypothetical protein